MRIVFTGQGSDHLGNRIDRATLTGWALDNGDSVQPHVDNWTNTLVASRTNTVKARKARELGVNVMTYPDWIASIGRARGVAGAASTVASNQPMPASPSGGRFTGTSRPGSPSLGDVWQPGGEGPAWRWEKGPGRSARRWVQIEGTGPVDNEWDGTRDERARMPLVFSDATPPDLDSLVLGDVWAPFNSIHFELQPNPDAEGVKWAITKGIDAARRLIRSNYREHSITQRSPTGKDEAVENFLLQHWNDLVVRWRTEERTQIALEKVEEERAVVEAEKTRRRFNVIRPGRKLDL